MSKRRFTKEQINELLGNPNVETCSEKSISYKKEFKIRAINKYQEGSTSSAIFKQAGFNLDIIGRKIPKWCLRRWRDVFNKKGIEKLSIETRGNHGGGRPKTNWQSDKEKLRYLETQVAYLKAENDFLIKLRKKS